MTERRDEVTLSIVHPFDPWAPGVGGSHTCIQGFVRYAPDDFVIEMVGVSTDAARRPVGRWIETRLGERALHFFAALHEREPDRVRHVPISLRFALACRAQRVSVSGRIVQFHRFESGFAVRRRPGQLAVYFLHNHPSALAAPIGGARWRHLPLLFRRSLLNRLRDAHAVWAVDPRTPPLVGDMAPPLDGGVHWLRQWADRSLFSPASWEERDRARALLRQELRLEPHRRIVLFAGRFEPQKDLLFLLSAFAELVEKSPDVALVLVGRGSLRSDLDAAMRRLGLEASARVLDPVDQTRLCQIYRGADVSACTSVDESGPRGVFESLASGTPVVSFDVGQVKSVLRALDGVGLLVTERTPGVFADALGRVLDWPPSPDLSRRCAAAVESCTPAASLTPVFERYRSWLTGPRA